MHSSILQSQNVQDRENAGEHSRIVFWTHEPERMINGVKLAEIGHNQS